MRLATRIRAAWDVLRGPKNLTPANPDPWFVEWVNGGLPSSSGEIVNSHTAMALSAYFGAIRAISEDVAKLPLNVYRRTDGGKEIERENPAFKLLHDTPSPSMSSMTFRETMTAHALGYSGGYAQIDRNTDGSVRTMTILDPTSVNVERSDAIGSDDFGRSAVQFRVRMQTGGSIILADRNVLHIHGLGFAGISGYLIASLGRESLGSALAQQRFKGTFFGNGTTSSGVLQIPQVMEDDAFARLRDQFAKRYSGSANQHKPILLEDGVTWSTTSTDPEKAQMVEATQFTVEDVARWFRIPLHKIGHLLHATFSNIEQQSIDYVNDTLMAWFVRWEQEIQRKVLVRREDADLFAEHNVTALLRGDAAARSTFYREQFNIGALSQNDIRRLENHNSIGPEGDTYYVNAAMVPSDLAAQGPPEPAPPPAPLPPAEPPDDDPAARMADALIQAHVPLLMDALGRVLRLETDKVTRDKTGGDFWDNHTMYVRSAVGSPLDAFVLALWPILTGSDANADAAGLAADAAADAASRHVGLSKTSADWADRVSDGTVRAFAEHVIIGLAEDCTKWAA